MKDPYNDTDENYDTFVNNLMALVLLNKVAWGILQAEIDVIVALLATWNSAWAIAKFKDSSTPAQKRAAKSARDALTPALRVFGIRWIVNNPKVTDDEVAACGLHRKSTIRNVPVPPTERPDVKTAPGPAWSLDVIVHSPTNPRSRTGRPADADQTEVYFSLGDNAPSDPNNFLVGNCVVSNEQTVRLQFTLADVGKKVRIFVRYRNHKGFGPWSILLDTTVPSFF